MLSEGVSACSYQAWASSSTACRRPSPQKLRRRVAKRTQSPIPPSLKESVFRVRIPPTAQDGGIGAFLAGMGLGLRVVRRKLA